jgi:hypothetical protein
VQERDGESYQWPEERDRYSRYRVFIGTTRTEGAVHIGLRADHPQTRKVGNDNRNKPSSLDPTP